MTEYNRKISTSWGGFFTVEDGEGDEYGDDERIDDVGAVPLKSNCGALLSRQYYIVLPSAIVFWIIMQASITSSSVCNEHIVVSEWTKQWNVAICGCFLLSSFHHLTISIMLANWYSKDIDLAYPRAVYSAAATVSFIAGMSALIKVFEDYKWVCIDALGVATFPSQWPEWSVTVPLLCYITIALEDKEYLEVDDIFIICGFFGMIALGYVVNLTTDIPTAIFFLIMSSACIASSYYLAQDASREIEVKTQVFLEAQRSTSSPMTTRKKWVLGRMVLKGRLSWLLLYLLPLFPIAYALRIVNVFTSDQLMVANFLCSVATKLIFLGILSLESIINQIQNKRDDQRRRLMQEQSVERKFKITPMIKSHNDKEGKGKVKIGGAGGGHHSSYTHIPNHLQHNTSTTGRSSDGDLYTQSPRSTERSGLLVGVQGTVVQSRSTPVSPGHSSYQIHPSNNRPSEGRTSNSFVPVVMTSGGGVSNLEELDQINGEELLLRDLEASAGTLLSSASSSSSSPQMTQVNASGQGLGSPKMNPKNNRNSGTRVSISQAAQRRAQSWSTEQIRSAIDSMDLNSGHMNSGRGT